ncbi:MAG: hypothetical protein PHY64_00500 [Eubacteriales bacterium]|nr:hypothetical protein [Eubacteriales bacterium]
MRKKHPLLFILRGQMVDWFYSLRTWIAVLVILAITYMNARSFNYWLANSGLYAHPGESIFYFLSSGFGNIAMTSAMFLVMMAEIPRPAAWQNPMLMRGSRTTWLFAQIMFCFVVTLLMILLMLLSTFFLTLPNITPGTGWSDAERIAADANAANQVQLIYPYIRILSPFIANLYAVAVLFAFWVTMTLVILLCTLCGKPGLGVILYASLLSLSVTVMWEMLPSWLRWMPTNFATITSIASRFEGNELTAVQYTLVAYVLLDALLVLAMLWRIKAMDLYFKERNDRY